MVAAGRPGEAQHRLNQASPDNSGRLAGNKDFSVFKGIKVFKDRQNENREW